VIREKRCLPVGRECTGGENPNNKIQIETGSDSTYVTSDKEQVELGCPQCSTLQKITLWKVLDGIQDHDGKQHLLAGLINLFDCKTCEYRAYLSCSFLYHDLKNDVVVLYIPFSFLEDDAFLAENFTRDGKTKIDLSFLKNSPGSNGPSYPHVVFTMIELVEYVHFRDRLAELDNGNFQ
jgi:CpXC protein